MKFRLKLQILLVKVKTLLISFYQKKIESKIEKLKEAESKKQEFSFSPRINKNSKVKADFFNRLDKFINKVNEKKAQNQINLEIINMDKDGVFIRKAKEIVIKKRIQSVDSSVNNMIQWSKNKNKQLLEKQIQKSNEILNQCSFKPTLTESTLKLTKNKPRGSYAKPLNTNSSKRDRLKTPFLTTSEEFKDDSKGLFYSGLRCYVKKETNNILKSNTKNKNNLNKKLSTSSIKTYMKTTHSINQKKKLPPKHQKQKSCGQFTLTLTSDNYLSFKESTDNNNVIKEININEISEIKTKRKRKISNDELSKAVHIRNLMNTSNNFDEQSFISRTSMKI